MPPTAFPAASEDGATALHLLASPRSSRDASAALRPRLSIAEPIAKVPSSSVPTQAPQAAADAARHERDAALAALLQQAACGNGAAYEAFYEQSFGYAQALARRVLRSAADLEDVLSAAYFQAWRELPRFDATRGSAITWLLTIVRSRALDALRKARAQPDRLDDGPESGELVADEPGPEALLQAVQSGARLWQALAELNASERWLLGLAYLRELSHAQIAAATGMPLGTVKATISRAQGKLREMLSAACEQNRVSP
jgi:RNA polymerase sigma-70 factor, ECF subfamily